MPLTLYPWFETLQGSAAQTFEQDYRHERQVNLWRILLTTAISAVVLYATASQGALPENLLGLAALGLSLTYSLVVLAILRRNRFIAWIKYISVLVDATLISMVLLGFMLAGRGIVATNSQVTFLVYFLLMALIARRYDVRLAAFGAIVILLEYLMVILVGFFLFAIPSIPPDSVYGSFSWLNQIGRALILSFSALIMINTVINARRLREQSIRDPMLGIFNRRYFEEVLALEFKYSRELEKPLTVVMMDLDHFKAYNDRHGHLKGDRVLVAVADFLLRNLRRNDVLARFGGDEFVFLLLETPPEGAGVTLMRLQDQMRRWLHGVLEVQEPATTFSFGVAGLSPEDTQPAQLIARADQHLYRAKAAGGGVICDEQGRIVPREELVEEP